MTKIGIFVEGQTERIFIVKFLSEYLGGEHNFSRIEIKNRGIKENEIVAKRTYPLAQYYFLIYDASGDGNVVPALQDRAEKLINESNYRYLIGIEDLYNRPRYKKRAVINTVNGLFNKYSFRDKLKFILAIMEIEAWFLADFNLFSRINPLATCEYIRNNLHIDLKRKNPENFRHPSDIVDRIYQLFGDRYKKREKQAYKIAYHLDYTLLYSSEEILNKVSSWRYFTECMDEALN